jgi:hypothetical protein
MLTRGSSRFLRLPRVADHTTLRDPRQFRRRARANREWTAHLRPMKFGWYWWCWCWLPIALPGRVPAGPGEAPPSRDNLYQAGAVWSPQVRDGGSYTGWHHYLGLFTIAVEAGSLGLWTRSAAPRPAGTAEWVCVDRRRRRAGAGHKSQRRIVLRDVRRVQRGPRSSGSRTTPRGALRSAG